MLELTAYRVIIVTLSDTSCDIVLTTSFLCSILRLSFNEPLIFNRRHNSQLNFSSTLPKVIFNNKVSSLELDFLHDSLTSHQSQVSSRMRRTNRRQVEQRSLELHYAEEHAMSSSLDESFGSVDNASESEEKRAASLESGAVPRSRDTCRRSRKGGKGGSACPRQQRRAGEHVGDLEKQLAAIRLGSPVSSEGLSIVDRQS